MLKSVDVKDKEASSNLESSSNMLAAPDAKKNIDITTNPTIKLEKKIDTISKNHQDDPKPRIVLTFRSEKSGARSNNMKIVSPEEKHEEISPRRSSRIRMPAMWDSEEEAELLTPKKEKNGPVSENDEMSDGSASRRVSLRRGKDSSDNAVARKDNEAGPVPRPSRRIKPTHKVLGNKELRWLQSQHDISHLLERAEEGVMTRRSARRRSYEAMEIKKEIEKVYDEEEDIEREEIEMEEEQCEGQSNNVKKLKHLCELGLRAIHPESPDGNSQETDDRDEDMEAEIDEDNELDEELLSKIAEVETASEGSDDDEEYFCSTTSFTERPRRSTRLCSGYGAESEEAASPTPDDSKLHPRRSSRKCRNHDSYLSENESRMPANGDDGSEATCPEDETGVIAACTCEEVSSLYAAPVDLIEPVFCQAVETIDGVRVGCSHRASKTAEGYAPLVRSGPRAPYILACNNHRHQMLKHMCCAACGLFCSQGIFYSCNLNHLFHLDCGVPGSQQVGCPHCGVFSYRWLPVNKECYRVRVTMKCKNKRVLLPEQRLQCTPAYLGFSALDPAVLEQDPVIPADLLPSLSVDLEVLRTRSDEEPEDAEVVCEAIYTGAGANELVPLIVCCPNINKMVGSCGTVCHVAARRGNLAALYLAHYAGADIDAVDARARTPLMCAVRALAKLTQPKAKSDSDLEMDVDQESEKEDVDLKDCDAEGATEAELLKVIRYLVAAGSDVNIQGIEGTTALHTAARYGLVDVCAAILRTARAHVDPRDMGGWTPLVWAAEHEHSSTVRLLLEHGADATATDVEGNAAAHWCALAGDALSLRLLVEASPRAVSAVNAHRDTPLHVAARQGHYACVVILLAHGAATDVENTAGELPVEVGSGECQSAISLNMQMAIATREKPSRYVMLSSDISNGRELHPIPCVNEIDDSPAPDEFTYVTRHVTPRPVQLDETTNTLQGCSCTDGACATDSCSCEVLGVRRWFYKGRLAEDFPFHEPPMLFQCNYACACNTKLCSNAVITRATQNGSVMIRACVFRAGGTRGWGLRTMVRVLRGAPVAAYCGELLSMADADLRSADHYMFALDLKQDLLEQCEYKVQLCVDAARFGSAARFINHSCAPNLAPVRVFSHCRDLRLPTVCLFATRDIERGEELTFDYGDKFWSVKSKWMKCECGTSECRYPLQSCEDYEGRLCPSGHLDPLERSINRVERILCATESILEHGKLYVCSEK